MIFKEITKEEYYQFWKKSAEKSFLSAPGMTGVKEGRKALFYGVFENKKNIGAVMIWETKKPLVGLEFYAPRGFLGDYTNEKFVDFFVSHLKDELRKKGGYVLRIEPNVEYFERDIEGRKVEGGYGNQKVVDSLQKNGFLKIKYSENTSQVVWEFVLSLVGKTKENIMHDFSTTTKRGIKQAEALGAELRELKREEIKDFYKILSETADRKSFKARDLKYFEGLYDMFHESGEVQFVSIVINPKKCLSRLLEQKEVCEKNNRKDELKSIESRIRKINDAFGEVNDEDITLSTGVFFVMEPEILFLSGGNVDRYLKLGGSPMLQWEMIKLAVDNGFKRYNFYGIEDMDNRKGRCGVYEFKRGFGGKVVQLIGEFELPLVGFKYKLAKILSSIRQRI